MYGIKQEILDRIAERRGRLHAYETLEAGKTALVIIDMQNYFVSADFPSASAAARDIVPTVNEAAKAVRAAGGTVVWIATASDGADHFWSSVHHFLRSPEQSKLRLAGLQDGKQWLCAVGPARRSRRKTCASPSAATAR